MKVYVIEKGCYSDRHVVTVVETQEEAEKLCENLGGDYADVSWEEYDTKEFQTKQIAYAVQHYYDGEWIAEYDEYYTHESENKNNHKEYSCRYVIFANSPQQAIKIAQDMEAVNNAIEEGLV